MTDEKTRARFMDIAVFERLKKDHGKKAIEGFS